MSNIKYFPHTLAHNKFKIKSVAYGYVDCEARIAKMCRLCEFAIPDLVWNVPHTILTEPGFLVAADHRCDLHLLMYVDVRILCVVTLPCRHGVSSILFLAPISWHDRLPYMQETQPSNFDSLKALAKIIAPTFWLYWWRLCSCSLISLILFSTFCVFFFLFFLMEITLILAWHHNYVHDVKWFMYAHSLFLNLHDYADSLGTYSTFIYQCIGIVLT